MLFHCIKKTNSIIKKSEIGTTWFGAYPNLTISLPNNSSITNWKTLFKISNNITRDIWNISTICYRIEFNRLKSLSDQELNSLFSSFTTLDIEHFHTVFRSIFDNLAYLISTSAKKQNQIPETFNDLLQFMDKKSNKFISLTNENLIKILKKYDEWFLSLREIRNGLIHEAHYSLVFGNQEEDIHFWIRNEKQYDKIKHSFPYFDQIKYNSNNVLSFSKYAGINFALLINLIEEISENIINYDNEIKITEFGGISSTGFKTILAWMNTVSDNKENSG